VWDAVALGCLTGRLACQSFGKLSVLSETLSYHFKFLSVNEAGVVTWRKRVMWCEFSSQDEHYHIVCVCVCVCMCMCVHVCSVIRAPVCPWIYGSSVVSWLLELQCRADRGTTSQSSKTLHLSVLAEQN